MAQYEHLPIYKASFDLLLHIEKVVAGFSRANKFAIGADLRGLGRRCLRLIVRANNVRDRRPELPAPIGPPSAAGRARTATIRGGGRVDRRRVVSGK
jgi:hypothetical protein